MLSPLPEFLNSNEIWYVEINQTLGYQSSFFTDGIYVII